MGNRLLELTFAKVNSDYDSIYSKITAQVGFNGINYYSTKSDFNILSNRATGLKYGKNLLIKNNENVPSVWFSVDGNLLINTLIIALKQFCVDYVCDFKVTFNTDSVKITISDKDFFTEKKNILYRTSTIVNKINNLIPLDDFSKLETNCEFCNKPKKSTIKQGYRNINVCEECEVKLSVCDSCRNTTFCEKVKNSINEEFNLCPHCNKRAKCRRCNKLELTFQFSTFTELSENDGLYNTTRVLSCKSCVQNHVKCDKCEHYYNSKYKICTCQMPEDFRNYIHGHDYNVLHELEMDYGTNELYGMEVEVGVSRKYRDLYKDIYTSTAKNILKGNAVAVYDSSIDFLDRKNNIRHGWRGFEIVTRPLNYENMIGFINLLSNKRSEFLRSWQIETTGIHIHVNRKYLTRIDIGKILLFINNPKNKNLVEFVSKRISTKFAKLNSKKKITDYDNDADICHYEAINTNKASTIEFRIFRGTLNQSTLISYLQFVRSLIEFVKQVPISSLDEEAYINFVFSTNNSRFRELKIRLRQVFDKNYEYEAEGEI